MLVDGWEQGIWCLGDFLGVFFLPSFSSTDFFFLLHLSGCGSLRIITWRLLCMVRICCWLLLSFAWWIFSSLLNSLDFLVVDGDTYIEMRDASIWWN